MNITSFLFSYALSLKNLRVVSSGYINFIKLCSYKVIEMKLICSNMCVMLRIFFQQIFNGLLGKLYWFTLQILKLRISQALYDHREIYYIVGSWTTQVWVHWSTYTQVFSNVNSIALHNLLLVKSIEAEPGLQRDHIFRGSTRC